MVRDTAFDASRREFQATITRFGFSLGFEPWGTSNTGFPEENSAPSSARPLSTARESSSGPRKTRSVYRARRPTVSSAHASSWYSLETSDEMAWRERRAD